MEFYKVNRSLTDTFVGIGQTVFKIIFHIQGSSSVAVQLTIILFLLNYMGIFMALTMGFGVLGIKVAVSERQQR